MKRATLILVILAGAAFAACGGGDDDDGEPTATPNTSEDSTAQSMLLTIQDFPTGWSEVPSDDDDEESPFEKECPIGERAEGITGRAESGDFEDTNDATITHLATVFESAEDVQPTSRSESSRSPGRPWGRTTFATRAPVTRHRSYRSPR